MSVARTHHTKDFTCMSNYHFKDRSISLKAKGLLSLMLSLPDTWDYSIAGLASLSNDGETSVRTTLKELEEHKYLTRTPVREDGKIIDWEYDIYEKPFDLPLVENPQVEIPLVENVDNKIYKQSNTKKENKVVSKDTTTEFSFGKQKPQKENLYTKCVSMINDYTTDKKLHDALIDYLRVRLEIKDRPLYANSWKGLLNKLDRDFDDSERLAVVYQSIEKGYVSFYPVSKIKYMLKTDESGASHVLRMTAEEYKKEAERLAELESRGERVRF